jgi:ubiquinone/menaquinone biosynthesis C-methylase UbiE
MLHHIFLLMQDGALFTAPLKDVLQVLDLGTGTGLWALDFAELVDLFQKT